MPPPATPPGKSPRRGPGPHVTAVTHDATRPSTEPPPRRIPLPGNRDRTSGWRAPPLTKATARNTARESPRRDPGPHVTAVTHDATRPSTEPPPQRIPLPGNRDRTSGWRAPPSTKATARNTARESPRRDPGPHVTAVTHDATRPSTEPPPQRIPLPGNRDRTSGWRAPPSTKATARNTARESPRRDPGPHVTAVTHDATRPSTEPPPQRIPLPGNRDRTSGWRAPPSTNATALYTDAQGPRSARHRSHARRHPSFDRTAATATRPRPARIRGPVRPLSVRRRRQAGGAPGFAAGDDCRSRSCARRSSESRFHSSPPEPAGSARSRRAAGG